MVELFDFGGSIVAPDKPDVNFLKEFYTFATSWLLEDKNRKLIVVVGGGAPARLFMNALKEKGVTDSDSLDRVGIKASHLNAQLVKEFFGDYCLDPVVEDPSVTFSMRGRVLVGAGWKPGFSTDYDAVVLADNFKLDRILNLSNIKQIYSCDPKKDPSAKPLEKLSWQEYKKMAGESWTPGANLPFDPVATAKASEMGLKVYTALGRDLNNVKNILENRPFVGTVIK